MTPSRRFVKTVTRKKSPRTTFRPWAERLEDRIQPSGGINENPIIGPQAIALAENPPAATAIGTVAASDPDEGQTLTYAITAGNDNAALGISGVFAIDPETGVLTVANSAGVDFETNPVFNLTVEVTDNGSPQLSSSATVTINLTDVALQVQQFIVRWGSSGQYDLVADPLKLTGRTLPWQNIKAIDMVFSDSLYDVTASLKGSKSAFSLDHAFNTNSLSLNFASNGWLSQGSFSLNLNDSRFGSFYSKKFRVQAGDYDGNAAVEQLDFVQVVYAARLFTINGRYDLLADTNGDGRSDFADALLVNSLIPKKVKK